MRFTERPNGRHMTTVHVAHLVTGDDLVAFVAPYLRPIHVENGRPFTEFYPMERRDVVALVRSELYRHGCEGHWCWADGFPDQEEVAARREAAVALVRELWPEVDIDDD